jgi:hypothetical protein
MASLQQQQLFALEVRTAAAAAAAVAFNGQYIRSAGFEAQRGESPISVFPPTQFMMKIAACRRCAKV